MTFAELIRILIVALIITVLFGFAPAIVHARDNVDRLYLIGGAVVMVASTIGVLSRLHQPLSLSTPVLVVGLLIWLASAVKSRGRRQQQRHSTDRREGA